MLQVEKRTVVLEVRAERERGEVEALNRERTADNFSQGADGGLKGPNGDTYLYPHTQVDIQASCWIPRSHGFQLVGYVLNVTNEVFGFYNGSEQFDIQREYYSRTYALGLRWTPSRESK